MKKIGNYSWRICERCGEKYVVCSQCEKHICNDMKSTNKKGLLDRIKYIFKI